MPYTITVNLFLNSIIKGMLRLFQQFFMDIFYTNGSLIYILLFNLIFLTFMNSKSYKILYFITK